MIIYVNDYDVGIEALPTPTITLLLLYKSVVRPHLEYALSVWCPYKIAGIKELQKVQKRATKLIINLKHVIHRQASAPQAFYFKIQKTPWRYGQLEIKRWSRNVGWGTVPLKP